MSDYDIIIVGAGMAGTSLGAKLAGDARVLLIEMEDVPGYHATGRSVAFWTESYGGPRVQPLTSASGPLLHKPDPAFAEQSFLTPRGALHVGRMGDEAPGNALTALFSGTGIQFARLEPAAVKSRIPGLRDDWTVGVAEPSTADIDVAALHAAYLRQFARRGGILRTDAGLIAASRDGAGWKVDTQAGAFTCSAIVNAAGAWADDVAGRCGVQQLGISALQRTVVQLRVDPATAADLPLVMDLNGRFYFKPAGAGRLWLSPHDEAPASPGDAAPDEIAVATAIERLRAVVDWEILAVERKWAGLRSFAPDRLPVYGHDNKMPGFFWFAGQGGFGIQTAPAAALLAASLITGYTRDASVARINAAAYSPQRFATAGNG